MGDCGEVRPSSIKSLQTMSAARCARASLQRSGQVKGYAEDADLVQRLSGSNPKHLSPFEHAAEALPRAERSGNFVGWQQLRKTFVDEAGGDYQKRHDRKVTRQALRRRKVGDWFMDKNDRVQLVDILPSKKIIPVDVFTKYFGAEAYYFGAPLQPQYVIRRPNGTHKVFRSVKGFKLACTPVES